MKKENKRGVVIPSRRTALTTINMQKKTLPPLKLEVWRTQRCLLLAVSLFERSYCVRLQVRSFLLCESRSLFLILFLIPNGTLASSVSMLLKVRITPTLDCCVVLSLSFFLSLFSSFHSILFSLLLFLFAKKIASFSLSFSFSFSLSLYFSFSGVFTLW
eukprot:TRINITY_DN5920_c0_g1_i1.p1 TRINITY_DN5920_c0_g1~~TRINITY_DN5920_c0_g1_i1.p1  ORF type:complete len:159 (+),score=9.28 TRINITY_DN5920_c0_g1_i1:641-1117(+)